MCLRSSFSSMFHSCQINKLLWHLAVMIWIKQSCALLLRHCNYIVCCCQKACLIQMSWSTHPSFHLKKNIIQLYFRISLDIIVGRYTTMWHMLTILWIYLIFSPQSRVIFAEGSIKLTASYKVYISAMLVVLVQIWFCVVKFFFVLSMLKLCFFYRDRFKWCCYFCLLGFVLACWEPFVVAAYTIMDVKIHGYLLRYSCFPILRLFYFCIHVLTMQWIRSK